MDLTILGIPKEGYGFSQNIKPTFSKPDFKDCMIQIDERKILEINLKRLMNSPGVQSLLSNRKECLEKYY